MLVAVGKTALALTIAHEWAPHYDDVQLFLNGRGLESSPSSAEELMSQVIRALHPTIQLPQNTSTWQNVYSRVLAGKRVLLVVDDACDAAQVSPLALSTDVALIVTSRNNFTIDARPAISLGCLAEEHACMLLRDICPKLTEPEALMLAKLCTGLPLALRLVGASLSLDADDRCGPPNVNYYAAKLADRGLRLAHIDAEGYVAGEASLSATLSLSVDRLTLQDRDAWLRLGVFASSFDSRAASVIAGADADCLLRLFRCSLLERVQPHRFRLNDLVAEYARNALRDLTGLHDELRTSHVRYYTSVGVEVNRLFLSGYSAEGLILFDSERTEIEAACEWLAAGSDLLSQMLFDLVDSVAQVASLRFHPSLQLIPWFTRIVASARRAGNSRAEGAALGHTGIAHSMLGDAKSAVECFEQALRISREISDRCAEGRHLGNLGTAHRALGNPRKAIECHEQAMEISIENKSRREEAADLGNIGCALLDLGDAAASIKYHERALVINYEIGNRRAEGNTYGNLGNAYAALGDAQKAVECYEQALVVSRDIGDRYMECICLGNLSNACINVGDVRKAIELQELSLRFSREIGDRSSECARLSNLGNSYYSMGDSLKAISLHEEALAINREISDRRGEGTDLGNLGICFASTGNRKRAIEYHKMALTICREIGDRRNEGNQLGNLGIAFRGLGDARAAIAYACQALQISRDIGDRRAESSDLNNLGNAYDDLGELPAAIECFEKALIIYRAIGDRRGEGSTLNNLGLAYSTLGNGRKAIECMELALAISREIGDRRAEGTRLGNLGSAVNDMGDTLSAIKYHKQALLISREIGDRCGEGADLANLGVASHALGELAQAIEYYEEDLVISREIGDMRMENTCLGNLAGVCSSLSPQKALTYYEQARNIRHALGDHLGEGNALWHSARLLWRIGDHDSAIKHASDARNILMAIGSPFVALIESQLEEWCTFGDSTSESGDMPDAEECTLTSCFQSFDWYDGDYYGQQGESLAFRQFIWKQGLQLAAVPVAPHRDASAAAFPSAESGRGVFCGVGYRRFSIASHSLPNDGLACH